MQSALMLELGLSGPPWINLNTFIVADSVNTKVPLLILAEKNDNNISIIRPDVKLWGSTEGDINKQGKQKLK